MLRIKIFSVFFFLFSCMFLTAQDTPDSSAINEPAPILKGSPVVLSGDTLFYIYVPLGAFTPAERARAVTGRLEEVIRDHGFHKDSLKLSTFENEYLISYKDRVLIVIGQRDTAGTDLGLEGLSHEIFTILSENLSSKSYSFNSWKILKNIGYTLVVLLVLILIIRAITWLFKKIFRYAEKNKTRLFKSIKLNEYEFLTAEKEYSVALYLLKIIKIGLIILLFIIALPVIFSIFPATEGITRRIIELVWGPVRNILMSVINYIPELITIVVIYIIFKYLIRFVKFLSGEVERQALVLPGFHSDWAKPTFNIVRVLLYGFMFVVIFPYLPGSDSPVFRGVSVFLGVLISLGSTSLISNTIAGLVITYMRPYKIGDRIKIDDVVGDVIEKTLMVTRIRTTKNEEVTIPNAKILTGYTVNYTSPTLGEGLIIHTTVTIGYDAPWRTVHRLLINAAEKTEGVISEPAPFVLQSSLDDFYVSYQINAYTKTSSGIVKMKSDLHQHIQDEFNRAGVEIMSPHYRAERDGNEVTIPVEGKRGNGEEGKRGNGEEGKRGNGEGGDL
jgi:small-conductance mechanosensitive channel